MEGRRYWFKRKTYGWGWVPSSWQGWVVLGVYTGGLISIFAKADEETLLSSSSFTSFFLPLIGLSVVLLVITLATGEKPRWQWGKNEKSSDQ